ncbi:hypothetical protein PC116_g32999, partial [Phytophthora cactorum]
MASSQAVQSDGLYYIYASSAEQTPSDNVNVLDEGSPVDTFVAALNDGKVIILSEKPSPKASFDDSDETKKWFQELDSTATGSLTLASDLKDIESFELQFTQPWPLVFSSASDVLLFTFGPPADGSNTSRIPPPGVDAEGNMLTFGLDFTQLSGIPSAKLSDLFAYAGSEGMVDYV